MSHVAQLTNDDVLVAGYFALTQAQSSDSSLPSGFEMKSEFRVGPPEAPDKQLPGVNLAMKSRSQVEVLIKSCEGVIWVSSKGRSEEEEESLIPYSVKHR